MCLGGMFQAEGAAHAKALGGGELPGIFHDNTEAVWLFKVPDGRGLSDMVLAGQLNLCVGVRAQAVTILQG